MEEEKKRMTIRRELIDELLKECSDPKQLLAEGGFLKQLTGALIERCLEAEMEEHLGYPKHGKRTEECTNVRNGRSRKTLKGSQGVVSIDMPRDRDASFEPVLIPKHETRLEGFDEKILALYARGMTTRDIQAQIQELYGVDISATFVSNVTEAVLDEVRQWQNRPLEVLYPIVYVDCLVVKVRENQRIINRALYLALGVNMQGQKELLGMWLGHNEGAKFWLSVFTELHNRGLKDMFVACVDGLTGLPEAIETLYPQTQVQLCMVHMVRNSLKYVSYKHRKEVAADLKQIYAAATEMEAEFQLELFAEKWDPKYASISKLWRSHWSHVIPLFTYPEDIRKVIYTTNAIESVNMSLRKVTRNHRMFPSEEAVYKVVYLAMFNIAKKWTMPIYHWVPALNCFALLFGERFPQ
ncbi:IS256 family transposase [Dictyobacter aurantiacus]|uniref:Mutator family transposase n=1 Tax=Dictyobacter aurantiacus TaxID=1936993 RepID=A0A401Z9N2_9CHLR|nr:IS256 family transposase [Dictyobacter aurantiacus]